MPPSTYRMAYMMTEEGKTVKNHGVESLSHHRGIADYGIGEMPVLKEKTSEMVNNP
jgi:hypothetical protein